MHKPSILKKKCTSFKKKQVQVLMIPLRKSEIKDNLLAINCLRKVLYKLNLNTLLNTLTINNTDFFLNQVEIQILFLLCIMQVQVTIIYRLIKIIHKVFLKVDECFLKANKILVQEAIISIHRPNRLKQKDVFLEENKKIMILIKTFLVPKNTILKYPNHINL